MTTYLGYKGYTLYKKQLTLNEQNTIKKDLTIKPYVPKNSMIKVKSFPVFRESQKKIYVPRFYGYENYGTPNEIRIDDGKNIELKFNGTLRDYQKPIVDKFLKHAKKYGCGLLEIHTGGGKTVLALDILSKLQKKTLIIVHKEFLLRQWKERIEEFLPNAKIGRIQGNIIDIENKDIVIGMLQSLYDKDYGPNGFQSFGLTIVDEVHRIGSEQFSKTLLKVTTPNMLGISATVDRKDGLTKVLYMFIGSKIYSKQREGEDPVCVRAIHFHSNDEEFNELETGISSDNMYRKVDYSKQSALWGNHFTESTQGWKLGVSALGSPGYALPPKNIAHNLRDFFVQFKQFNDWSNANMLNPHFLVSSLWGIVLLSLYAWSIIQNRSELSALSLVVISCFFTIPFLGLAAVSYLHGFNYSLYATHTIEYSIVLIFPIIIIDFQKVFQ